MFYTTSAIESIHNSFTSLNKRISKDRVSERKESQKSNCLFLYKTSKTDNAANKQRSPYSVEQDEAKKPLLGNVKKFHTSRKLRNKKTQLRQLERKS